MGVARISERGFGFIEPLKHNKKDVYFHCTAVRNMKFDTLQEGDEVEYNVQQDSGHSGLRVQELYLLKSKRPRSGSRGRRRGRGRGRRSPRRRRSFSPRRRRRY